MTWKPNPMSSGEPTDVTISMRVHGAEMKLGRLASGPTGQLVIDTQEVPTAQPSTTAPGSKSLSRPPESTSEQPLILTSSGESSGKSPPAKNMATSMGISLEPTPWKKL